MSIGKTGGLFDDESSAAGGESGIGEKSKIMIAHVDGGSRGNPGPAGYGAYITDGEGRKLAELNDFLGVQTNNFAEYSGLIAALEYAVENGYGTVRAVSDSELMVKQMKGQYKVRSEALLPIYTEAKALLRKLDRFEIRHVLRHLNKDADRLANEAMDRGMKRADPAKSDSTKSSAVRAEVPRADAYAKPPVRAEEIKELRGFVRGGVVEFTGEKFPDGVFVVVRRAR
jgi:probable phosphoglycerate mutase